MVSFIHYKQQNKLYIFYLHDKLLKENMVKV